MPALSQDEMGNSCADARSEEVDDLTESKRSVVAAQMCKLQGPGKFETRESFIVAMSR